VHGDLVVEDHGTGTWPEETYESGQVAGSQALGAQKVQGVSANFVSKDLAPGGAEVAKPDQNRGRKSRGRGGRGGTE